MKVFLKMTKSEFLSASLTQLAKDTDVPAATWGRWLRGDMSPSVDKLEEISRTLGMDRLEFLEVFFERRDLTIKRRSQLDS